MHQTNFGIVGTGVIASRFARACALAGGAKAYAVVSRDMGRAREFAREHGVDACYTSITDMARDTEVDCVYIATPNTLHHSNCMEALDAGKPVLCEKPFTMNRAQAEAVFEKAREKRLFAMEAMWTRFLPNMISVKRWIDEGRIGRVKLINSVFSHAVAPSAPNAPRLMKRELGGGATYDLFVYALSVAAYLTGGVPPDIAGFAADTEPGSDEASAITARLRGGALMTAISGLGCAAPKFMTIYGESGRIEIKDFNMAREAALFTESGESEVLHGDHGLTDGLVWQIRAVRGYLESGALTSDIMPPEETIEITDALGRLMKGFYPKEYAEN